MEAGKILKECQITGFADEIAMEIDSQIEVLKQLGISWIEFRSADGINVADHTLEQAKALKEKLDRNGIHISAMGSPIGKIGIEEAFEPHLEQLEHVMDVAEVMNCKYIRMFSFFIPEGKDPEEYRDTVMERLEKMVEAAKRRGFVLLHENEKDIYGDVASRCLELQKRFGGENFKCVFDFANFVQCGQDTQEAYEILKPYIAYIHVKDAKADSGEVVLPGEGDGNLSQILQNLNDNDYSGFLSIEPHLVDFGGFAKLEKNGKQMEEGDGAKAFGSAYEALKGLLG